MKLVIFPSLSHVISCSGIALRERRTLRESLYWHYWEQLVYCPTVWKTLEQREIAEVFVCKVCQDCAIRLACFMFFARLFISWHTLQYIASISARVLSPLFSERIVQELLRESVRHHVPVFKHWAWIQIIPTYLIQIFYKLVVFVSWLKLLFPSPGRLAVSSTSITSTEWCAASERPLSVIMFGCCILFLSAASTNVYTQSFTYSWIE